MKRNILLFTIIIIASLLLAIPIGLLINRYVFTSSGFSTFSLPDDLSAFMNGLPLIYLALSTLIFGIFSNYKKWLIILITVMPVIIFSIFVSSKFLIWSIIFFISGAIIANVVNFLKNRA